MQNTWTAVDNYITDMLVPFDPVLDMALQNSKAAGLPQHNVSPAQGKLLHILARMQKARAILEIGTLGGYSAIWLARALPPDGRLITLEAEADHAEVARANIANAELSDKVELRLGSALDTLPKISAENRAPFDLIFIDADKPNNPDYFTWAMKLSRLGSIIVIDNVIRDGAIIDTNSASPSVHGIRRMNEMIAAEPRVTATAIQTVGVKGYDGFAIALVL